MTDEARQMFLTVVRDTLKGAFDEEELGEITLEANLGPVYRAFILVFDECAVPSHPSLPEPTFRLKDGGDIFFIYLLNEIAARGGEITGEIVNRHPAEIAQNRAVEASENWKPYSDSENHLKRLTGAKRLPDSFPNPLLGYCKILSANHKTFSPAELKDAYCKIAAYNKATSPAKAGKARGAQRKREVEHGTIPDIELAVESLIEEGSKPTQKAVAERSGYGIATIKRHWSHARIVKARNLV